MDSVPTGMKSDPPAGNTGFAPSTEETEATVEEPELISLLATLRVEAAPEADFEGRFLCDLRDRIAREAVCRPARTLLWEHITQFLTNLIHRRRLTLGATACGTFALCSAYFAWSPGGGAESRAEVALTNRFESTLSSLKPGAAKDVTRISVGKPSAARAAVSSATGLRTSVLFAEADESYDPSYTRPHQQEGMSVPQVGDSRALPTIGF